MSKNTDRSARFVRTTLPPFPIPKRLGIRLFITRHELECHKADLMGLARPPEPKRIELVSLVVAASELGISLKALKRRAAAGAD